jgi:hypothetical protein
MIKRNVGPEAENSSAPKERWLNLDALVQSR